MLHKFLLPAITVVLAFSLAACSGGDANSRRLEYKKAVVEKPLEVPPDLTLPQSGDSGTEIPLLSAQGRAAGEGGDQVLPPQSNVHVAGFDSERWLVVDMTPDQLWPKLKQFWPSLGLTLVRNDPSLGIMETDWAENRANIKGGMLSKIFSGLQSEPTRDKYRLRLERDDNGKSEIYVAHYGIEQVVKSTDTEGFNQTTWQARPSDPELSIEILKRLMVYLGSPEESANAMAVTEQVGPKVTLVDEGGPALRLDEEFERAWRLTGIALDRIGLVVEDRDRSSGVYFVSKVELLEGEKKDGWFSSLFASKDKKKSALPHYRVKVAAEGDGSLITLEDALGKRLTSDNARALLEQMRGQMQ